MNIVFGDFWLCFAIFSYLDVEVWWESIWNKAAYRLLLKNEHLVVIRRYSKADWFRVPLSQKMVTLKLARKYLRWWFPAYIEELYHYCSRKELYVEPSGMHHWFHTVAVIPNSERRGSLNLLTIRNSKEAKPRPAYIRIQGGLFVGLELYFQDQHMYNIGTPWPGKDGQDFTIHELPAYQVGIEYCRQHGFIPNLLPFLRKKLTVDELTEGIAVWLQEGGDVFIDLQACSGKRLCDYLPQGKGALTLITEKAVSYTELTIPFFNRYETNEHRGSYFSLIPLRHYQRTVSYLGSNRSHAFYTKVIRHFFQVQWRGAADSICQVLSLYLAPEPHELSLYAKYSYMMYSRLHSL